MVIITGTSVVVLGVISISIKNRGEVGWKHVIRVSLVSFSALFCVFHPSSLYSHHTHILKPCLLLPSVVNVSPHSVSLSNCIIRTCYRHLSTKHPHLQDDLLHLVYFLPLFALWTTCRKLPPPCPIACSHARCRLPPVPGTLQELNLG